MSGRNRQTESMKSSTEQTRVVEYVSPSSAEIEQYVLTVCRKLGEQLDNGYDTTEFRHELTTLVKTVVSISLNEANQRQQALEYYNAKK